MSAAEEELRLFAAPDPLDSPFEVQPFSVLDTTERGWGLRRQLWLNLGITSEVGRDGKLLFGNQAQLLSYKVHCNRCGHDGRVKAGEPCANPRFPECEGKYVVDDDYSKKAATGMASGTSVFDPVLCEAVYRWYCPPGGKVLDPFAGGSVRGVVAGRLGRGYDGVELRGAQVAANSEQLGVITAGEYGRVDPLPVWYEGDSAEVLWRWASSMADAAGPTGATATEYDLVFSCPPYYDLEVYSDSPADLSNMQPQQFRAAHAAIIKAAVTMLRPDRFAVWVVGDVRDAAGPLHGLALKDTIRAFEAAGCALYNDAILVNSIGTLPMRIKKQFNAGRKVGRRHQYVLTFVKGNPREAANLCEPVLQGLPDTGGDDGNA